jgi:hypothetical protein
MEKYLINEFEEAVVRRCENGEYYVKFKGKKEFKAVLGSGVVTEARIDEKYISKEEYDKF